MAEGQRPVAIVTGGAQGIGAAICVALLKEGYQVCIADIQEEKGKKFMAEQQQEFGKGRVMFSLCDVSKDEQFDATFQLTLENFKRIDVLVNNAGISPSNHEEREVISVNLMGVMIGCQMAFKYMGKSKGRNGGVVINTASIAGLFPFPKCPDYAASKHGVVGYTRSYGHPTHLEKEGIMFAAICPSYTDTELLKFGGSEPSPDIPLIPNLLKPEFVAGGVLKILHERINGSILVIAKETGYQYVGLPEDLKSMIPKLEEIRQHFPE